MPEIEETALYQVVVRLKSVQSLKKVLKGRNGEQDTVVEEPRGQQEKTMLEYLVLQKMMVRGKEGPWKAWGTTEESDAKDVLKEQSEKPKLGSPALAK